MVQDISYRLDVVVQRMYASHVPTNYKHHLGLSASEQTRLGLVIWVEALFSPAMNYWEGEVESWI